MRNLVSSSNNIEVKKQKVMTPIEELVSLTGLTKQKAEVYLKSTVAALDRHSILTHTIKI